MTQQLSESENIVIREIFRNPQIGLDEIASILGEERKKWSLAQDKRLQKQVDVRSVSKFKSLALKKIKRNLKELSDNFRLDYSVQGRTKQEQLDEMRNSEILLNNGIIIGYDFRDDRKVYLFYSVQNGAILPWQDHTCNEKCHDQCYDILGLFRKDYGLDPVENRSSIRDEFIKSIEEIVDRVKE